MTVLLSWSTFDETQTLLPMYFVLARQLPNDRDTEVRIMPLELK